MTTTVKSVVDKGPLLFARKLWILARTSQKDREISHFQFATSLVPIFLGPIGIASLLSSNYIKNPYSKMPDSPFLTGTIQSLGQAFPLIFQALTFNNIGIAINWASPSRLITYVSLAIANIFNGKREKKLFEIANQIREINQSIEKLPPNSAETKEQLEAQIKALSEEAGKLNAQVGFFGRVLYNIIMLPSFLCYLPYISGTTRFGRVSKEGEIGPYTGQITQGYTFSHLINGYKDGKNPTPSWIKLLFTNGKKEFQCWIKSLKEAFEDIKDPTVSQGTIWGGNQRVEDFLKNNPKWKNSTFKRWGARLSGGLLPSTLNSLNIIMRLGIIAFSLGAVSQLGLGIFNKNSVFDLKNKTEQDNSSQSTSKNAFGESLLGISNFFVGSARQLSGISGLLIAANPSFAVSGSSAILCQGTGSALSMLAAFAGGIKGVPASFDNSIQFMSSLFFWLGSGMSVLTPRMEKGKAHEVIERVLNNRGLESRRLAHA